MTAAAINSGVQVANGFMQIFQAMLNNFWATIPTLVNLFASPTGSVPAIPGLDALGAASNTAAQAAAAIPAGIAAAANLPNMFSLANTQLIEPVRQLQPKREKSSVEMMGDNIETLANNVFRNVWQTRGMVRWNLIGFDP